MVRIDQDKQYYVQDLWVPNIMTKTRKDVELRIMTSVIRAWRGPSAAAEVFSQKCLLVWYLIFLSLLTANVPYLDARRSSKWFRMLYNRAELNTDRSHSIGAAPDRQMVTPPLSSKPRPHSPKYSLPRLPDQVIFVTCLLVIHA